MIIAKVVNENLGTFGEVLRFNEITNDVFTVYVDDETGEYYYPEDIEEINIGE